MEERVCKNCKYFVVNDYCKKHIEDMDKWKHNCSHEKNKQRILVKGCNELVVKVCNMQVSVDFSCNRFAEKNK